MSRSERGAAHRARRHEEQRDRRQRRIIVASLAVGGAILVAIFAVRMVPLRGSVPREEQARDVARPESPTNDPIPTASNTPSAAPDPAAWPAFAEAGAVELTLPNPGVTAIAYHQATYDDALPMKPVGTMLRNYAGRLLDPVPDSPGPRYIVQPQRSGRSTEPTSAVDVVAPANMDIYAPVDGTVVRVKRYKLYGTYPDMRIEIKPDADPGSRVVIIHVDDVAVRDGDHVSATLSVLGAPRVFPFHSVVNDYVEGGDPHVHIEVKGAS